MEDKKYKIKIDQDALYDFLMGDGQPTQHQLDEINKVITVVLIRHFSNYVDNEDLREDALLYVFEKRRQYDPSWSGYNYIYTGVRNEIGNKIKKYTKEKFIDDYIPFDNRAYDMDIEELPSEVRKYGAYLLGQKPFSVVKIPKVDVLPLMLFLMSTDRRIPQVPDFVQDDEYAVNKLYKLLNDYIKDCV